VTTAPLREDDVGSVRVLTLDRPHARNALSTSLLDALADALERLDADDSVHAAVLTGADPAFCAGVDLKQAADDPDYFTRFGSDNAITRVAALTTPMIGAINGATFTGGLELALGCDFLIASERAFFGDTHARVGVLPGGGMTVRLPQAVGLRQALQMSLTSELVDAHRAVAIGLVNEVVPHEELLPRAVAIATAIAEADPTIVRALKAMYVDASRETPARGLAIERERSSAWNIDLVGLAERRDQVMATNRARRNRRSVP
jgi:enoyl-CoA hydratase/carnithine racemase